MCWRVGFFFFKQKTAYEMRISDWSSDVCSSDLETMLGVLRQEGERFWLQGIEKKERREFAVSDIGGAAAGDLVRAEKTGRGPRISAKVVERLGDPFAARNFSLIAIEKLGIPDVFPEKIGRAHV